MCKHKYVIFLANREDKNIKPGDECIPVQCGQCTKSGILVFKDKKLYLTELLKPSPKARLQV